MDNNPYPSQLHLWIEQVEEDLIVEHNQSVAEFQAIVRAAKAAIAKLPRPLGSLASGYDMDDIDAILDEWLVPTDAQRLNDRAADLAKDMAQ